MISGFVNHDLEPCLELSLQSPDGRQARIAAVIDTGFAGCLLVPRKVVDRLRLPLIGTITGILADESEAELGRYLGFVLWNRRKREIEVLAGEGDPLIGTEMLRNHSLHVMMVPDGEVIIRPRRDR